MALALLQVLGLQKHPLAPNHFCSPTHPRSVDGRGAWKKREVSGGRAGRQIWLTVYEELQRLRSMLPSAHAVEDLSDATVRAIAAGKSDIDHGFLPPKLFNRIRTAMLELSIQGRQESTPRD